MRDNALDELASYVDISYKEKFDGIVKVSVEGVEFVDEARCYEMGKNRVMRSRDLSPLLDTSFRYRERRLRQCIQLYNTDLLGS